MSDYTPFLVIGVSVGSIYGVAAMGLVLSYKTAGIFNFAHGAVGAAAAYTFFEIRQRMGLPWPVALLVSVVVFGVVAGVLLERLARGLAKVPTAYRIVATVGLLVAIRALLLLIFGSGTLSFQPFLPQSEALEISGVTVTVDNVVTLVFGVVSAAGLYALFRYSKLGTAMRAVVDDPDLLDLTGLSPTKVRRASWIIGAVFASASGVLFASVQQSVDATLISLLVVQAFGAAALGAFTSLPLAYLGGIGVGIVQAVFSKLVASDPGFQGLDTNVPFIVLFLALLVIPRHRLVELGRPVKARIVDRPPRSPRTLALLLLVIGSAALVLPHLVGTRLPLWSNALSQVLLFASLGLLVRTSGQISLGQVGFAAIGAVWFAKALDAGVPWALAVLVGGLVALPVGAFIAIPAIRLSGVFLALATLGFGVFLAQFVYRKGVLFGDQVNFPTGRPEIFGLDTDVGYYHVLLVAAVVGLGCIVLVERSRLGRLLRGVSDSPLALATLGANVNITKVIVFAVAAFMAGVSGGLFAGQFGSINGESFVFFQSVVLLVVLVISGRSTVVAAVVAPLLSIVLPGYIGNADAELLLQVSFGVAAIVVSLLAQRSVPELLSGGQRVPGAADRSASTTRARLEGWRLPASAAMPFDGRADRVLASPRPSGRTT